MSALSQNQNRWVRIFVFGLIIVSTSSITFIFAAAVMQIPSRYRIASQGATVQGWITRKEPENHGGLIDYAYNVGRETYTDKGGVGNSFEQLKVGDKITVTYDPQKPSVSSVGRP